MALSSRVTSLMGAPVSAASYPPAAGRATARESAGKRLTAGRPAAMLPPMPLTHPSIDLLLDLLDQAFDRKAWHGPNLRGSVRRVTPAQAAWRPQPERHSIAEIVVHAAYWKYAIRRKLRGDARGSFAIKGSNWFPQPADFDERDWRRCVAILCDEHQALRAAVIDLDPDLVLQPAPASRYSYAYLIHGAAAHDVYHAGQVQVLKRLQ